MARSVFKPVRQRQQMLLPPDLSDLIPKDHLVRVVDAIIEAIDADELYALYPGGGASAHDPKMMLKVVVYAYASGIYSSRKIARATRENVHFMWIAGMAPLDRMTVSRFRSERIRPVFESVFAQVVELLATRGLVTLNTYFLDGTKAEVAASKRTFTWKRATENHQAKLRAKIHAHLDEIDRMNEEESRLAEALPKPEEVTSEGIAEAARRINERLRARPKDKNLKRAKRAFEGDYLPRTKRYESQMALFEGRSSFPKTDPDATFMRMKEDHMRNGQLKAGCNVQIGTEGQFIVSYTLPRRAGDAACMIEHLRRTSGDLPRVVVSDAGYGSEENYAYLQSHGVEAFVKYNMFHKEQKRSFKADPAQLKNWVFDEKSDTWTRSEGRTLAFLKEKTTKSDLGFESTTRLYHCDDCSGCPIEQDALKATTGREIAPSIQTKPKEGLQAMRGCS